MSVSNLGGSVTVDLGKIAQFVNFILPVFIFIFFTLGYFVNFNFHFLTVGFVLFTALNVYYLKFQTKHTLLSNFGIIAQLRYMLESVGPEFRQYLYLSDTEEKPFNRIDRSEVYRKAKGVDSSSSFGSQLNFDNKEIKLRHSMYPTDKEKMSPFCVRFGEERGIVNIYELKRPILISAMSYGALGSNAVRALARGAKKAGILMNTGEGGYPKYPLMEGCDLIFQIGTAKFGVRNPDSSLNEVKLKEISSKPEVKMIEIKFSQGAKPGKGGLLPKEKITKEISELRGVPLGEDVISPAHHIECTDSVKTVEFIKRVQDLSQLPVGIKLCIGNEDQFVELIVKMKELSAFPDYISIDGAEGGTGAGPKSFMDDFGVPIFKALPFVHKTLTGLGVRQKMKIMAAGKLINPGKQFMAYSMGADAVYTARGFMMSLGCIQALQCSNNTCPVGITTHQEKLQKGLDIEEKSERVKNYVESLHHDHLEMLSSIGKNKFSDLSVKNLYMSKDL